MKTVQVSVEFWQRLKVEAAVRGVSVRSVLEEIGAEWLSRHPRDLIGLSVELVANRGAIAALQALKPVPLVRELKVELEE